MNRNDKGQFGSVHELTGEYQKIHDDYGGWVTSHTNNDRTEYRLKAGAKAWLAWCEDRDADPLDATEETVKMFVLDKLEDGHAETHISRVFSSVAKFYHFLGTDPRQPDIDGNPTADISLPEDFGIRNVANYVRVIHQDGRPDVIAPPKHEVLTVCDHATGKPGITRERNELIMRVLWQTAMRCDEVSRIRTENVDLDQREITIRSSKLNPEYHPDLYIRRCWWEPSLDYLMHRHYNQQQNQEYFFTSNNIAGDKLSPSYISRLAKEAARKAGESNDNDVDQEPLARDVNGDVAQYLWTGHRFRHARISYLANETDMPIQHIRLMAGHAKIETTMQYVRTDWSAARNSFFNTVVSDY